MYYLFEGATGGKYSYKSFAMILKQHYVAFSLQKKN